jgi:hypothetical protein
MLLSLLLTLPQVCVAQQEVKLVPFTWPSNLGWDLDIDGDRMIVGAPIENSPLGGLLGAAYVYERVGNTWSLKDVLADSQGGVASNPFFGTAISLDGDQAAVGAGGTMIAAGQNGYVFTFVKPGPNWVQEAKLAAGEQSIGFGFAVDMKGDTLLIGSPHPGYGGSGIISGKAFIFVRQASGWTKQAKLTIPYALGSDRFGYAVALQGDTAFIGSPGIPASPWIAAGSVYVYRRAGKLWYLQQEIVPDDSQIGDFFGGSLAVDGDTLVVGSRGLLDPVLGSTVGDGGAYVFARHGDMWVQEAKFVPQARTIGCSSGWSVALNGSLIALGAPNGYPPDGGACFVYSRFGKQWFEVLKVSPFKGDADAFGFSMALDGDSLAIGAPVDKTFPDGGAAYVYRIKGGILTPAFYCSGKPVAQCMPRIFAAGEPSISGAVAGDKHDVWALDVRPKVKGMLAYSTSGPAQLPFAGGTLCLKTPIVRTPLQTSTSYYTGTVCHGYFKFDFSAWIKSGVDPALQAGRQVWFQYWYREPSFAPPNNVGLTGAMTAIICQ